MLNDTNKIIQSLKKGDHKDFEKLFRHYYPILCKYAYRILNNSKEAEDIVQQIFCKIWEKRKSIEIHSSFKAYLYRSTYINSLNLLRKKKKQSTYQTEMMQSREGSSKNKAEQIEVNQIIQQTLEKLPERSKEIFFLSRFEGLKYKEIADRLSISIKTVEANMGKALQAFRKSLKDYIKTIVL